MSASVAAQSSQGLRLQRSYQQAYGFSRSRSLDCEDGVDAQLHAVCRRGGTQAARGGTLRPQERSTHRRARDQAGPTSRRRHAKCVPAKLERAHDELAIAGPVDKGLHDLPLQNACACTFGCLLSVNGAECADSVRSAAGLVVEGSYAETRAQEGNLHASFRKPKRPRNGRDRIPKSVTPSCSTAFTSDGL